jgi:ATP-dependent helicase HrpA
LSERQNRGTADDRTKRKPSRDPAKEQWIVAAEIVETSRLFARTAARIIPGWIEELGQHFCRRVVEEPHWNADKGCVMARERVTVQGLVIAYRQVPYVRVNPDEAREIFVRAALVADDAPLEFPFVHHNRKLCDKIASRLAYAGRLNRRELEESLVTWYLARLPHLGSIRELEEFVRRELSTAPELLHAQAHDLWGGKEVELDTALFPDQLDIAGTAVEVSYRYDPGSDRDGVTLAVPLALAQRLPARALDGAIPGLREQQIFYLLRALPKEYRLRLDAFAETARIIASDEAFKRKPLLEGIVDILRGRFGIEVPLEVLSLAELPHQLRPRVQVSDAQGIVASSRDLATLQEKLSAEVTQTVPLAWNSIRLKWERDHVLAWDFGDLPEALEVTQISGVPVSVHPALVAENGIPALRLLESRAEAVERSKVGVDLLLTSSLLKELQDLAKQSKAVDPLRPLITLFCTIDNLREGVTDAATKHLLEREHHYPLVEGHYKAALTAAKSRVPNLIPTIVEWTRQVLELRRAIVDVKRPYSGMREELNVLIPPNFLSVVPFEQLRHLPRYLKAMVVRAERADGDPRRDKQRAEQVAPYVEMVKRGESGLRSDFRWMVEEFKVSVFAQELGTAYPVSASRLDKVLAATSGSGGRGR